MSTNQDKPVIPSNRSQSEAIDWIKSHFDGATAGQIVDLARLLDRTWSEGFECGDLSHRIKQLQRL